mgnify:CR=1 FL=1
MIARIPRSVLAHISIPVSDLTRSRTFYDRVLHPLGIRRLSNSSDSSGYGIPGKLQFWIVFAPSPPSVEPSDLFHIAFECKSRAAVRKFFTVATELGAIIEGVPERQPEYSENYYAAYIKDPDGYRIEAMTLSTEVNRSESTLKEIQSKRPSQRQHA